jgi:hypothetical protein
MDEKTDLYVARGDRTAEIHDLVSEFERKYGRPAAEDGFQSCQYHGDGRTHFIFYDPTLDVLDELTSGEGWSRVTR